MASIILMRSSSTSGSGWKGPQGIRIRWCPRVCTVTESEPVLMTETSKAVLLLSLALASAESEDGDDAQRRILVSILGSQDRFFTTLNVALPAVSLLLTNFTASESWFGFPSLSTSRFRSLYAHCVTLKSSLASLIIYFFLGSRIDANSPLILT